ncbi:MAG: GNAT family N-acetyltransferase [Candidatus Nitronauta litoralis]|uniref:GNAT family N-acetyltransferase n=1 Tax=Candidatus Nitronauta litoralis TaxID=2705533 RepID=A0A7T0G091_9BACT|nr:MAG: GNAT family N-acetyltransferase [Candidatus Nitronauta litoralis]
MASINPPNAHDKSDWLKLWQGYLEFYKSDLPEKISDLTWERFFDPNEPVFSLGAYEGETMVGFVNYILHRSTWSESHYCYLEDIFVSPSKRGRGIGGQLISAVQDCAQEAGCARLYWMTHEDNITAQMLYDKVARKSGFIQYRLPLE